MYKMLQTLILSAFGAFFFLSNLFVRACTTLIVLDAKTYDDEFNRRKFIMTINTIICTDGLIEYISEYFLVDRLVNSMYNQKMNKGLNQTLEKQRET